MEPFPLNAQLTSKTLSRDTTKNAVHTHTHTHSERERDREAYGHSNSKVGPLSREKKKNY
jgi:hypothetical protein